MTSTINADKIMNSSGDQDSGVDLLVNDTVKIKTANTDRITVTDSAASMGDNFKLKLGTGNDLNVYHDGSNSYIEETGTGDTHVVSNHIRLRADNINLSNNANNLDGLTMDSNGYISLPKQPLLSRFLYSNQTIATNTLTPLQFNGTSWITGGGRGFTVANTHSRYTPLAAGYYFVSARARFQTGSGVAAAQLSININGTGTGTYRGYDYHASLDNYESMHISNVIYLGTSDYFEIVIYQNSGSNQTATGTGSDGACILSAMKVA